MARAAIGLALAVPVLLAAIFVLTAVLSAWMLWAVAWWYIYGYRRHRYGRGGHHQAYGGQRHAHRRAGVGPGRGFSA